MRRVRTDERERLEFQAREYASLRDIERAAEERRKAYGEELLPEMQNQQVNKLKIDYDSDRSVTVSVKEREVNRIDESKLRKRIGASAYNKLTTASLDEAKLEAAIKLGEVDRNIVAECMETTKKPYLEARFGKKRRST